MTNKSIFYSYEKLKSYNALLNFIVAERGVGKTYGAIKEVVTDFLKNGNQFIYVRRYKTELAQCINTFWDALINEGEFEEHELKTKKVKDGAQFFIDGRLCGFAVPLSTSAILKSTSFPQVRTIVFDEFIITKSVYHYLQDEVTQMLELVETVFRLRDNGRVWFLGNATTSTNPYFDYFRLSVPYQSEFKTFKDGLILVNYVKNEAYREAKKKTRFGQLIDGTHYGDYAIDNEFLLDSKSFVFKRPSNSRFMYVVKVREQMYGVWSDDEGVMYISRDYDPNCKAVMAITEEDHDENTLYFGRMNPLVKAIVDKYREGDLRFDDQVVKFRMVDNLLRFA